MNFFNNFKERKKSKKEIKIISENEIRTTFVDGKDRCHEISETSFCINPSALKNIRKKFPYGIIEERKSFIQISLVYGDFVIPYICKSESGKFKFVENAISKIAYLLIDKGNTSKVEISNYSSGHSRIIISKNHTAIAEISIYICDGRVIIFFETLKQEVSIQKKICIKYGIKYTVEVHFIKDNIVMEKEVFFVDKGEVIKFNY